MIFFLYIFLSVGKRGLKHLEKMKKGLIRPPKNEKVLDTFGSISGLMSIIPALMSLMLGFNTYP